MKKSLMIVAALAVTGYTAYAGEQEHPKGKEHPTTVAAKAEHPEAAAQNEHPKGQMEHPKGQMEHPKAQAEQPAAAGAEAQPEPQPPVTEHILLTPLNLKWEDAPPALPPGAKMAVLEGSPKKAGIFTARFKLPAGYKVMPHWHPADERITVIQGTLAMGKGDKFDMKALHALPPGSFSVMPAKMHHFAMAKSETVIQLNVIGPWGLNYVNPSDDPRNQKTSR